MTSPAHDLRRLGWLFQIDAEFTGAVRVGSGHINDTYLSTYRNGTASPKRYVHQRINHHVFQQPVAVMENVARVTEHCRRKLSAMADPGGRTALTLVPARDGLPYCRDAEGNYWRTYDFIEGTRTCDEVEAPGQAFEAARAFGDFQRYLTDLPGDRLHETIPNFHHTPSRFAALARAIEADPLNRARDVQSEIQFALERETITGVLAGLQAAGVIPERIAHNDTKLNNVLLSVESGRALCVVDLDTVMPGLVLHDFGDMIRTATSPAAEDERDLSKVSMQMPMFRALVDGYLSAAGDFLTQTERDHLAFSGKLITLELAMRFLTDHLLGDTYFRIHREGHNLDRARSQFALVASIEAHEEEMAAYVTAWRGSDTDAVKG